MEELDLSPSSVRNYTLKCNASGDPHPNITWTKDGVPASQFNASSYFLHLVDVQREDAGSYICTASNGFGDNAIAIGLVNIKCKYSKLNWFNEEDMYIVHSIFLIILGVLGYNMHPLIFRQKRIKLTN